MHPTLDEPLVIFQSLHLPSFEIETDCACSSWSPLPDRQEPTSSAAALLQTAPALYRAALDDRHEVAANPFGPAPSLR
jgi:hypothetical protein